MDAFKLAIPIFYCIVGIMYLLMGFDAFRAYGKRNLSFIMWGIGMLTLAVGVYAYHIALYAVGIVSMSIGVAFFFQNRNQNREMLLIRNAITDIGVLSGEPKTGEYSILLSDAGEQKIRVIKQLIDIYDIGLYQAKMIVDSAPNVIKAEVSKHEAEYVKDKLSSDGATVTIVEND